jgi:hypothetical protein
MGGGGRKEGGGRTRGQEAVVSGELEHPDEFIRKANGRQKRTDWVAIESCGELWRGCLEWFRAMRRVVFVLENLVRLLQFLPLRLNLANQYCKGLDSHQCWIFDECKEDRSLCSLKFFMKGKV